MVRPHLPLNALRAFEASARHLSFTRAAIELSVSQAAISHQVKQLEQRLGTTLVKRLPRGISLTDEGSALLPTLRDAFDRISELLERIEGGRVSEVLTVGAVGTFAVGWLLPRLVRFREAYPFVDLRLSTNNNRVDIAAEGLDYAIRFGAGAWHDTWTERLFEAPLSPLMVPKVAERLSKPDDLVGETLLRSYRADEWPNWFSAAGVLAPSIKGPIFDSSGLMVEAALQGEGIALAPPRMFARHIQDGRLRQPFATSVSMGCYWLTRLHSRRPTPAMEAFRRWILAESTVGGHSPAGSTSAAASEARSPDP